MSSPEVYLLLRERNKLCAPLPTDDVLAYLGAQIVEKLDLSYSTLAVRGAPTPALAILGHLCERDRNQIDDLTSQLQTVLHRFYYVSYEQIEEGCQTLAETLRQRVGTELLSEAHFVGIPRGGPIVLGMLGYALDLPHAQLEQSPTGKTPLVVVDDCALTGSRFNRFLQQHPDREVIFAPLYAHPELCAAIERAEPQVTACVNAQDLHDYAPEELGDDYSEWQARWHQRHTDKRYWIGRTEHLCFPWGEADTVTWDTEREEPAQGLSVVPPEHRLKTQPTDELCGSTSESVQVQPTPTGPLRPVSSVFFGKVDDHTIVANPDADLCLALDGTAATMWHALVEHGTMDDTLDALLQRYSTDRSTLRADLVDFISRLATHDLLVVPDGYLN